MWEEARLLYGAAKREKELARSVLVQQKSQDDVSQPKPRSLAHALQALYLAESQDEVLPTLSAKTADEHALDELAENAQELAPVLSAMRAGAVDRAMLEGLGENADSGLVENDDAAAGSEEEAAGEAEDDDHGVDAKQIVTLNHEPKACTASERQKSKRANGEGKASVALSLPKASATQRRARPSRPEEAQTELAPPVAGAVSGKHNWRGEREPEPESEAIFASQGSSICDSQDSFSLSQEDWQAELESALLTDSGVGASTSEGQEVPRSDDGKDGCDPSASSDSLGGAIVVPAPQGDARDAAGGANAHNSGIAIPPPDVSVEPARPVKRMRLMRKTRDPSYKPLGLDSTCDGAYSDGIVDGVSCEVAPAAAEAQSHDKTSKEVRKRVRTKAPSTSWQASAGA